MTPKCNGLRERYFWPSAAGSFRARHNQLWQVVLSPSGVPAGYRAPR